MDSTPYRLKDLQAREAVECPIGFHARVVPERTAIEQPSGTITYAELDTAVDRTAARIRDLLAGDTPIVGIYRAPKIDTIVWTFAVLRLGGSVVFPGDREPESRLEIILSEAPTACLVTDCSIQTAPFPIVRPDIWQGGVADNGRNRDNAVRSHTDNHTSAELVLDAPATWLYTSGTSGQPKMAVHSVRNHVVSAAASNARTPVGPESRWLLSLPLYHVGGLGILFRTFIGCGAVVLSEKKLSISEAISALKPTHVSLVATQLKRLLSSRPTAPAALESVLVGGGPVDAELVRQAVRGRYPIRTTYGMTELSSQIATSDVIRGERDRYPAGLPIDGIVLRLADDGEVLVRSPMLIPGYASGGRIKPVDAPNGWFATGDIGSLENGELSILGRKDEMFISGGENIHPEEIEQELAACPEIERAMVIPVKDEEYGLRPVALVQWRDGIVRELPIREKLERRLPKFKVPVKFLPWPETEDRGELKTSRASLKSAMQEMWSERDRVAGASVENEDGPETDGH